MSSVRVLKALFFFKDGGEGDWWSFWVISLADAIQMTVMDLKERKSIFVSFPLI